jgi:uncharacterized protein YlxW (UPF0749 family)
MIDETEYYKHYFNYSYLITEMQGKLIEARIKNPKADYSDAEKKIKTLKDLQSLFFRMYQYQNSIEILNRKYANLNMRIEADNDKMAKEIEELKKNIPEL